MRFRIKSPEEGEGIELLPIGEKGDLPHKVPMDAAEKSDQALDKLK